MKRYECVACEKVLTADEVYACHSPCGSWTTFRCDTCNTRVIEVLPEVREVCLAKPMPVMQSVKVTDEMIENGDIPY